MVPQALLYNENTPQLITATPRIPIRISQLTHGEASAPQRWSDSELELCNCSGV